MRGKRAPRHPAVVVVGFKPSHESRVQDVKNFTKINSDIRPGSAANPGIAFDGRAHYVGLDLVRPVSCIGG